MLRRQLYVNVSGRDMRKISLNIYRIISGFLIKSDICIGDMNQIFHSLNKMKTSK